MIPGIIKSIGNEFLLKRGNYMIAKVTSKGKQVLKLKTSNQKCSIVRYPETGTIVKTIVERVR